jgi:LysM repeat protein
VAAAPKEEAPKAVAEVVPTDDASFITYEVKPGDTLWGIANKFPGVSADNIKSWNKVDELIKAGEKLRSKPKPYQIIHQINTLVRCRVCRNRFTFFFSSWH